VVFSGERAEEMEWGGQYEWWKLNTRYACWLGR